MGCGDSVWVDRRQKDLVFDVGAVALDYTGSKFGDINDRQNSRSKRSKFARRCVAAVGLGFRV